MNGNYTCNGITQEEQMLLVSLSPWIEGMAQTSVAAIGILANCIAIPVLCTKQMNSSIFNRLLVFLAIFDNIHLLLAIVDSIRLEFGSSLGTHEFHQLLFVYFLYPVQNINLCCTIYMTTVLGFERYQKLIISIVMPIF